MRINPDLCKTLFKNEFLHIRGYLQQKSLPTRADPDGMNPKHLPQKSPTTSTV